MFSAIYAREALDKAPSLMPLNTLLSSQYSNHNDKPVLIEQLRRTRSRLLTILKVPNEQLTEDLTLEKIDLRNRIDILTKLIRGGPTITTSTSSSSSSDTTSSSSSSSDDDEPPPPAAQHFAGGYERYKAGG
jgi:hypothetical protein